MDINDSVRLMVGVVGIWNLALFTLASNRSINGWLIRYGESIHQDSIGWLQPLIAWFVAGLLVPVAAIWLIYVHVIQWEIGGVLGTVGGFAFQLILAIAVAVEWCRGALWRLGFVITTLVMLSVVMPHFVHAAIASAEPPKSLQTRTGDSLKEIKELLPDVHFGVADGVGAALGSTVTQWDTPMILVAEKKLADFGDAELMANLWHEVGHLVHRDPDYGHWLQRSFEILVLTLAYWLARKFVDNGAYGVRFTGTFRLSAAVATLGLIGLLVIAFHRQYMELRADEFAAARVGADHVSAMLRSQPERGHGVLIGLLLYPSDVERLRRMSG